jgi:hypothetical protein
MFASRVQLLSDYAQRYLKKARESQRKQGFFKSLFEILAPETRTFHIKGTEQNFSNEEELKNQGFVAFCEIDNRKIFFNKDQGVCLVAITCEGKPWDLSDWGSDSEFVQHLIAEVYFMVTRDDYRIDEDEELVLLALIGYLEPTESEIVSARNMVYWSLIEKVLEDNLVTEEETAQMLKIREAIKIDEEDVYDLHKEALLDRFNEFKQKQEQESQLDLAQLDKLKQMAEKLGIDSKIFDR